MARSRTPVRSIAGVATAGLLLAGCGLGDVLAGGDDESEPTTEPATEGEPADEPADQPGDEPTEGTEPEDGPAGTSDEDADPTQEPSDEPSEDGSASDEDDPDAEEDASSSPFEVRTGSVDIDEIVSFDTGVQVAVTQVTVEPMAVFVDIEAVNGFTEEITFAWSDPSLEDNTGRSYPYVPPESNVELLVPAGGSLSATIAFQGALNPSASTLSLELNSGLDRDRRPGATFRDLPLPEDG